MDNTLIYVDIYNPLSWDHFKPYNNYTVIIIIIFGSTTADFKAINVIRMHVGIVDATRFQVVGVGFYGTGRTIKSGCALQQIKFTPVPYSRSDCVLG